MALIFTGIGVVYSYSQTPLYETTATFVVNPNTRIAETYDLLYSIDTLAGRTSLATTYSNILESRANLETAALSLGIPLDMLADYDTSAVVLPDSSVILLQVKGPSPQLAADLANAIGSAGVDYVADLQAIYELRHVDLAVVESDPVSPDHATDMVLSTIVGIVGGLAFAILRQILAQALQKEQASLDPALAFNAPVGVDNPNSHDEIQVETNSPAQPLTPQLHISDKQPPSNLATETAKVDNWRLAAKNAKSRTPSQPLPTSPLDPIPLKRSTKK